MRANNLPPDIAGAAEQLTEFNFDYVGAGYFREKEVPHGDRAKILHAPQVANMLINLLPRLAALEQALREMLPNCVQCEGDGWILVALPHDLNAREDCPSCSAARRVLEGK